MPERVHFNPKRAIKRLERGESPELVFSGVFAQGLPKIIFDDFYWDHLRTPRNLDPKKDIVNTFFTALAQDVSEIAKKSLVHGELFPFKSTDPVSKSDLRDYLEPLFAGSYRDLKRDVVTVSESTTPKPSFDLVYESLSEWIAPPRDKVLAKMILRISDEGEALRVNGRDYQALITEKYFNSVGVAPTHEQLLDMVTVSSSILTVPASKDISFMHQFHELATATIGDSGIKYKRDSFSLDQTGGISKVVIDPNIRARMERNWRYQRKGGMLGFFEKLFKRFISDDPVHVTGCPMLHGGLIDAALDIYVRSARARMLDRVP